MVLIRRSLRTGTVLALAAALAACGGAEEDSAGEGTGDPSAEPLPVGTIAGALSYPGSYLPENMQVCAENRASGEVTCKGGFEGDAYVMDLPAGNYHVWAQSDDFGEDYRAYYSRAVECGLSIECADHTPVTVKVEAGEVNADIDPGDWYAR